MTFTILNIFFILFIGLLFLTLFGFAILVLENDRDFLKQFNEESSIKKEQTRTRRIEIVAKAAANFNKVRDLD